MCHVLCVIIYQLFISTVRIIKSTAGTVFQVQGITTDFLRHHQKKGDIYTSDTRGTVRLGYWNLHIMTAEYFLASKSFLSIFLGRKTFRFTVPLILLMSPVHFGLPFPFSSSNHFKFSFLHKACLPWSNFHLLFFSLFFLFFRISILITHCL